MNKVKKQGQVYTPLSIVKLMLDSVGYEGCKILKKHIIDNSCGDGAFLTEIVFRYCNEYFQSNNSDLKKLKNECDFAKSHYGKKNDRHGIRFYGKMERGR